ncbi:hypothetical protein [Calothrix sp. PCC 6303]|uniref:hypothetical protein n=1 Tax=Calothrix sp. PCC 6303 TaxID=1170562 RepID=UPI0002A03622|nr:hypothetical protein [Calothrix sp. PCC 6303]AFZ00507.1 hypothetical protein Cal6303_1458 [Calothrix sp. PCC 6303]
MSNIYNKSYDSKPLFSTQNLVLANISWGVLALLYFLLFSAKIPTATTEGVQELRAQWYLIGTNVFEAVAYLGAGILCLRNWRSSQIVNSHNVWLAIGGGMLSYFFGGIIFGYMEIVLKQEPFPSVADIFFVITYLLIVPGMVWAVASRRIKLEIWQWIVTLAIGIFSSSLAWLISNTTPCEEEEIAAWAVQLARILNWFYVVSDVLLLIIATALLLAFWGGRVSQSWRMIAAAAFSLYIADMWQKFGTTLCKYQSGGILEVFFVLGGVLFGMGAVLEYDASWNRSRRERGRKRP